MESEPPPIEYVRRRRRASLLRSRARLAPAGADQDRLGPEPLFLDQDVDYVSAFQALGRLERRIEDGTVDSEILVERSRITHALGDYRTSAEDAVLAAYLEPNHAEAHFRAGVAFLALAALRMEIITRGPGMVKPSETDDPAEILDAARRAFAIANQLEHENASQGLESTRRLVAILAQRETPSIA